jgi:hypothetical protein
VLVLVRLLLLLPMGLQTICCLWLQVCRALLLLLLCTVIRLLLLCVLLLLLLTRACTSCLQLLDPAGHTKHTHSCVNTQGCVTHKAV